MYGALLNNNHKKKDKYLFDKRRILYNVSGVYEKLPDNIGK